MAKKTRSTLLSAALGVVLVGALLLVLWRAFDIEARIELRSAIGDIVAGEHYDEARETLVRINRRRAVIEGLTAVLDSDDTDVRGKWRVMRVLADFRESRVLGRSLRSEVPSTRYAAALYSQNNEKSREEVKRVAVEWLNNPDASDRDLAALLCQRVDAREAVPALYGLLDDDSGTEDAMRARAAALNVLVSFDVEGIADRALAIAKDQGAGRSLRRAALDALSRLESVPLDETRELAISILTGKNASNNILRTVASTILRRKDLGDERTWKVLESVLLDPEEQDAVIQRLCLNALGDTAPLDRLEELLLKREVYNHRYFGIRSDVATALAVLNVRKKIVIDLMANYLVDEDEADQIHAVRREGWLTLYQLTGIVKGVRETELFPNYRIKPIKDEAQIRAYLWKFRFLRNGINKAQDEALGKVIGDLGEMKKIRELYTSAAVWQRIEAAWKADAEREAGAGAEAGKPEDPGKND